MDTARVDETCDKRRGSLHCEECDNWVIVKKIPKSERYPHGFLVARCKLDTAREETAGEVKKGGH